MTSTTRTSIIVLLLTLGLGSGLGALMWYLNQESVELRAQLQAIRNQEAVEQAYRSLSLLLEQTATDRAIISEQIIDGEQGTIAFLNKVEALARQYQVELSGADLQTAVQEDLDIEVLRLQFNFSGPTVSTKEFIQTVEQFPYASYIDTLTYSEQEAGTPEATLSGQLTLLAAIHNLES
jgi:hypothetical protein